MSAQELLASSTDKIRRALDQGEVTSVQLTEAALERAHQTNEKTNAFISFCDESAIKEAKAADERIKAGEKNPVLGIPIALKDLILTHGHKSTAASRMLENFIPPYDATVTAKLKKDGAPIFGKTNLDEFAMGSSNETSFFGEVKNPWNLDRVPGGSSGGSAAAVAARVSPFSLGTDTGGSIRQPSSLCGITGIKPTYGRVSRYGVVAFASSLDQVGPMCSDALGCAAVLESISGKDVHDMTSRELKVPNYYENTLQYAKKDSLKGLRIGLPKEFFGPGLNEEVKKSIENALDFYRSEGAETVEVDLPHSKYSLATYYIVCTSEASSNLARYDGVHYGHRTERLTGNLEDLYARNRGEGFGAEVRLRILLGTFCLSSGYYDAYYKKASQVRTLMKKDFDAAFAKCDVIMGPTSPTTAFKIAEKMDDPVAMYLNDNYTLSTNLAGLPALSMNVGFDSQKLPIGMQIWAPWWKEDEILGLSHYYQNKNPDTVKGAPL